MVDPITLLIMVLAIGIGGLLVSIGVHFVPVGGAPAAMAQATGIGTGTTMLAASAGFLGLISAGLVMEEMMIGKIEYASFVAAVGDGTLFSPAGIVANIGGIAMILAAGIIGAMLMMVILGGVSNILYVYGLGVPLVSAKVKYDPITGDRQDLYVTRGTEGHGTPTVALVSAVIGGILGGFGGSLIYLVFLAGGFSVAAAAIGAIGIFFVNSVLASYNITGTIEGFHDPKFKRWPRAFVASAIASIIIGVWVAAIIYMGVA
ncbi:tetrahydromethanopterin S-methyltransferase subunit D [Methanocella sp. CWC-04]|uniref:Tetrahydromethanopterin S-methyltransferase subunit D n=1 Tax=Methanooceanicella nereidis TaxID=2052831 RepID=A0AAP2REE8_9EURY|nr:tetrahydromethanopterin S-methyltransferase subunit D [Methanocella sp. CWC-04]